MTISTNPLTAADKAWEEKMARLRARKPLERSVTLVDEDLVRAAEDAQQELGRAEAIARAELETKHADLKNSTERRARVEKEIPRNKLVRERQQILNEAEAARDDAEIKLWFRALGADIYEGMQAQHPPTEDQRKQGQTYNIKTFGPALVSACCTDPMTPQDAASLIGGDYEVLDADGKPTGKWASAEASLGFGEAQLVFTACVAVNEGSQALLGKG